MNYSCTAYELKCNECGKRFGNQPLSACPDCLAPLEVAYDLEAARGVFTREAIAAGPPSIWRYAALLPIPAGYQPDLPVGFTPLIKANNLDGALRSKSWATFARGYNGPGYAQNAYDKKMAQAYARWKARGG